MSMDVDKNYFFLSRKKHAIILNVTDNVSMQQNVQRTFAEYFIEFD